jgi:hypothetical protein
MHTGTETPQKAHSQKTYEMMPATPASFTCCIMLSLSWQSKRGEHGISGPADRRVPSSSGRQAVRHLALLLRLDHHRRHRRPEGRSGLALARCDEAAGDRRDAKAERCGGGQHGHQEQAGGTHVRPRSRAEERRLEKMGGERGKTSLTTPIFPTNPNPNHYTWKSPATPPPRPGDAFQLIVITAFKCKLCTGTYPCKAQQTWWSVESTTTVNLPPF